MSTPDTLRREADYIKYGFLSANAKEAIHRFLATRTLSESDSAALRKGQEFIQQIADGAQFVTSGNTGRYTVAESMNALDLAINPLNGLANLQAMDGMPEAFQHISKIMETVLTDPGQIHDQEVQVLRSVEEFFEAMCGSLNVSLAKTRHASKRPRIATDRIKAYA